MSTGKVEILASTGKGRIRASIGNGGSRPVPEMWDPDEYREGKIQVSTRNVGSGRVPGR